MSDKRSASSQYEELRLEVALCTALMIASSEDEHLLTHEEVDRLLGVRTRPRG